MNQQEIQEKLHRENINIASINKRALAFMIDEIIITLLFAVIVWDKLSSISSQQEMMAYVSSLAIYIIGVKMVYQAFFVYMYGATIGKIIVKIRVIESEYLGLPTLSQSILRAVMRSISEMLFYIGFVVAYFTPIRLTWHDRVATTLVVDV